MKDSMDLALKLAVLAGFVLNIVLFARALRSSFVRPDGVRLRMRGLVVCGTVASVSDALLLWFAPERTLCLLGGAALLVCSQWVYRSAVRATTRHKLSLAFSGDAPTHLNESGIYSRVRHPFYLAYTLTWLGAVAGTLHWGAILGLVMMFCFYLAAALHEERKFLASGLAAEYRAYRRRTGMFLPKPINK